MNGTIERPVEEQTESRGSVFIATTENPFFDGVFRQYHLDAGGKGKARIYDSKELSLYSYGVQNPVVMIDPDGNKTWPVASTQIRTEAGSPYVGYYGAASPGNVTGLHKGVDIAGNIGDPVTATDTGIVFFAGNAGKTLGNVVRIETIKINDDGTAEASVSEVAHLGDVFVQKGDLIEEGNVVGTLGQSGNAKNTSPHVHYDENRSSAMRRQDYRNPSDTYTAEEKKQQSIPETDYNKVKNDENGN